VRAAFRPRSDTEDSPAVELPAPIALVVAPSEDTAEIELSSASVLVTPLREMSSRVSTCTGSAVSESMRLIDEPVTSMRCSSVGCARAPEQASALKAAGTLHAPRFRGCFMVLLEIGDEPVSKCA
jgi:hypothetical protein